MIYFDNSSSSFYKPSEVIQSVSATLALLPVNSGRSSHPLAAKAALALSKTRERAAEIFKCDYERTIFTYGCTDALNIAILGSAKRGGHVVTTVYEHNSVLRPLYHLYKNNIIDLTIVKPRKDGHIYDKDIFSALRRNTYMVVINGISNVTGEILPVNDVSKKLRSENIMLLTDGAQAVGHMQLDYQNIDMLTIAPHKGLHAPQGVGLLLMSKKAKVMPIRYGGTGTMSNLPIQPNELPETLESGTLPLPAIMGLHAALVVYEREHSAWQEKVSLLGEYALTLLRKMPFVTLYTQNPTAGIIAFNVNGYSSDEIAEKLSQENICVRAGLQCAPLVHEFYETQKRGMVRASFGPDNTFSEIEFFARILSNYDR